MIQIRETTPLFFFLASPSRKDSSKEYKEQDKSVDRSARNDDRGKTCQCGSDEYEHAHDGMIAGRLFAVPSKRFALRYG